MNDDRLKSQVEHLTIELPFLAKEIVDLQYEIQPEFHKYGSKGLLHSIDDAKFNLQYLLSSIEIESKILFEQYNKWVNQLFANLKLPVKTLEVFYDCTKTVIKERFRKGFIDETLCDKLLDYIDSGISVLRLQMEDSDLLVVQKNNPLKTLLDEYSKCVLSGDKSVATKFVLDLTKNEAIEVKEIYQYIIRPFQIELGRLWHKNLITVGQEHYATAISQFAMGSLYERIFQTDKNGKVFLGTCAQGDLHEFGIRMVCDFMECSGWNTYYLGANMTNNGIIQMIKNIKPNIIAISCTMTFNISSVKNLISSIRDSGIQIPIIVGGYSFNLDTSLWLNAGADGYSEDLEEVLSLSEKLSSGGSCEETR